LFQELKPKRLLEIRRYTPKRISNKLKHLWLRNPRLNAISRQRWPQSFAYATLRLKSKDPQTLALKMWHRLGNDRRPVLTVLSDKYAVREYVRARIGENYLTKLYQVWQKGEKVDWQNFPPEFVAKSTHGVGGSIIVSRAANRTAMELPFKGDHWKIELVSPQDFVPGIAEKYFSKWVSQRYDKHLPVRPSWSYKNIPPRVIVEELLSTSGGGIPNDYKFYCFDGICHLIEVDIDRFGDYRRDFYSPQWEKLDAKLTIPNSDVLIPRPSKLAEMVEISEVLSRGLDFVTVDLYDVDGRVVFGEISFYNGGGHEVFAQESMEHWLGSLWNLPSHKRK
jgi:hypothetical protein